MAIKDHSTRLFIFNKLYDCIKSHFADVVTVEKQRKGDTHIMLIILKGPEYIKRKPLYYWDNKEGESDEDTIKFKQGQVSFQTGKTKY